MSVAVSQPSTSSRKSVAPLAGFSGRQRRTEAKTDRVRRDGKFFRLGEEKFYVKGVTYGPFKPDADGLPLPDRAQIRRDFERMLELGANCVRIYHTPPVWFHGSGPGDGAENFPGRGVAEESDVHRRRGTDSTGARGGASGRAGVRKSSGRLCDQRRQRNSLRHRALRRPAEDRGVHR